LDLQRVARFTLLRLCTVYLSSSLVACIHEMKALAIFIAQGACVTTLSEISDTCLSQIAKQAKEKPLDEQTHFQFSFQ